MKELARTPVCVHVLRNRFTPQCHKLRTHILPQHMYYKHGCIMIIYSFGNIRYLLVTSL